ncbi:MAG TPA: hypothetical protein VIL28_02295 [Steroidobacteraceae bacterium]
MLDFFGEYFVPVLILIALAVALTIFVFRHRIFDRGYRKGQAANPKQVKRENRSESWRRSA